MSLKQLLLLLITSFVPVFANSADQTVLQSILTPVQKNDGWRVGSALSAGFEQEKITALAKALHNDEYINVHALLIERNGELVYEQYRSGFDQSWGRPIGNIDYDGTQKHDLRSISKSVTALLLGIAIGSDFENTLNQPILSFLPDYKNKVTIGIEQITLRQVLTMSAGFDWNEMTVPYSDNNNDELQLYYTRDPFGYVLAKPLREKPDERWYYNGGMTMLVAAVVENLSGQPFLDFAREVLFKPLGIDNFTWLKSSAWPSDMMPAVASGLRLLPRDLAKIGSLMVNNGKWQNRQIVPAEWIALSAIRYRNDTQPWDRDGAYGYGLHWWQGEFRVADKLVSAPTGVGYGGQRLFTLDDKSLSVTVLSGNYGSASEQTRGQSERIFRRVLNALP